MMTPTLDSLIFLVHGGTSCHGPLPRVSYLPRINANSSRPWSARGLLPNPWPSAVGLSSTPPPTTIPPTNSLPHYSIATDTRSASGVNALSPTASRAFAMLHAPAGPGVFPPDERLHVVNLATSKTED